MQNFQNSRAKLNGMKVECVGLWGWVGMEQINNARDFQRFGVTNPARFGAVRVSGRRNFVADLYAMSVETVYHFGLGLFVPLKIRGHQRASGRGDVAGHNC